MHYSQDIIEEIINRNDVVSVVSQYVRLEKKGSNYWGLCPFHNEKTPSFSVTPTKQIFYCFGCHKGGNSIHFISGVENIGYYDAIRFLAEKSGINLPEGNDEEEIKRARIRKTIIEVNVETAKFYRDKLLNNTFALKYLTDRGLTQKTIMNFGLGYAPSVNNELYNYLKNKNFDDFILGKSGLFIKDKQGNNIDRYKNRIMFPIFDLMGNVIAFGGRVTNDSKPKYINSPETPAYSKGKHLYAMNFAKKHINKQIIITEGYMDVISLHQAGIKNSVASLGTALTDSQGRVLKKYCEEVIISFDSDSAGQKAAMRGLDILNNLDLRVKVLKLPDGKDPDDYIKKNGADNFNSVVQKALPLVEYKAESFLKNVNIDTIEGKSAFMNNLAVVLASIENMVEREMYVRRFSKLYGVSEQAILYDVEKLMSGRNSESGKLRQTNINIDIQVKKREEELAHYKEEEKILYLEMLLLTLICGNNDIYLKLRNGIDAEWFYIKENAEIAGRIFQSINEKTEVHTELLMEMAGEEKRARFAQIAVNDCNFEDNLKAAADIISKKDLIIKGMRRDEIIMLLADPNIGIDEKGKLNLELKEILKKNRSDK